jgi:undecaprenyl diphosphate synthase
MVLARVSMSPLSMPTPPPSTGIHVAIIMDGNGRWATARKKPRTFGHRAGAETVRSIVEAAPSCGITTLTLFAFSSDNWKRPPREVTAHMSLLKRYVTSEADRCVKEGVRLHIIGRRDRLDASLVKVIERAEERTAGGTKLRLRIAVDFAGRETIMRAATLAAGTTLEKATFATLLGQACHDAGPVPDVDLLIRTGGEQRLSDFLLWECAYAELVFTPRMWPDFTKDDLADAVTAFRSRDRRFGAAPKA